MLRDLLKSTIIGAICTALSYGVALVVGWPLAVGFWLGVEVFSVFTSYVCTLLCVYQRRVNYPIGAVSTAAYAALFWHAGLAASAILNVYLTPALIYGWIRWRSDADARPVTHVSLKMIPVYLAVAAAMLGGALLLVHAIGSAIVLTDALILVGTYLAQFLMDNKKIENWPVWAAVNVLAIYTYYKFALYLVVFQYILFLGNTIYGWVEWTRKDRPDVVAPEPAAVPVADTDWNAAYAGLS